MVRMRSAPVPPGALVGVGAPGWCRWARCSPVVVSVRRLVSVCAVGTCKHAHAQTQGNVCEICMGGGGGVYQHLARALLQQRAPLERPPIDPATDNSLAQFRAPSSPQARERAPPRGANPPDVVVRRVTALRRALPRSVADSMHESRQSYYRYCILLRVRLYFMYGTAVPYRYSCTRVRAMYEYYE